MTFNQKLLTFIKTSPTAFHAIEQMRQILEANGFEALVPQAQWNLQAGKKYYVMRNHTSLAAFYLPREMNDVHVQVTASHSDSPMLKLKPNGIMTKEHAYVQWEAEVYGGMIMSSWLDRPLSIAGRIFYREGSAVKEKLVDLKEPVALIPNMAIHQNRKMNDGMSYNAQIDLLPVIGWGDGRKDRIMERIAEMAGVDQASIVSHDLFLYHCEPGVMWAEDQYISAPRLDDLQCAFASLQAFVDLPIPQHHIPMMVCFDNEEVGSMSRQGAWSTFFPDVLHRILKAFDQDDEYQRILTKSFMVSADNAQAVHPNHPELADPQNRVQINQGVVIKYNANQAYTSDAMSAGVFKAICEQAGVPVQSFVNRSDVSGGSTLGRLLLTQASMACVDVGLPQWAMHSSFETAGGMDGVWLVQALRQFYNTYIIITDDVITLSQQA